VVRALLPTTRDAAPALTFTHGHRIRQLADHLALLIPAKDVFHDANLDKRRWEFSSIPGCGKQSRRAAMAVNPVDTGVLLPDSCGGNKRHFRCQMD
jgi:hypothetical protein